MSDVNTKKQIIDTPRDILSKKEANEKIKNHPERPFQSKEGFSSLEPEVRGDVLMNSLINYFGVPQNTGKNDFKKMEEWVPYAEGIMDLIESTYCKDLSKLRSYSIDDRGVLELVYTDGRKDHITLLMDSLKLGREATKRAATHEQSRISRESIREKYETESYLGGDVLVVYEKMGSTLKSGAEQYGSTAVMAGYAARSLAPGVMRIASITYRAFDGTRKSVKIDASAENTGTKERLSSRIISELSLKGVVPDVLRGGFAPRSLGAIHKTQFDFLKMSYSDFIAQGGGEQLSRRVSKNDFEISKQQILSEISRFETEMTGQRKTGEELAKEFKEWLKVKTFGANNEFSPKNIRTSITNNKLGLAKGAIGMPLHVMMLGVFANKFHENSQDSMMMMASLGEAAAFEVGSYIGSGLSNRLLLGRGKLFTGLAFGMWATGRSEKLAHAISLDKRAWIEYPEREDEEEKMKKTGEGKSFTDHAISLGTVNDLLDNPNIPYTNKKKPRGDFRIPSTRGGVDFQGVEVKWAKVPQIHGDPITSLISAMGLSLPYPARVGKDAYTSIPDIALYKHNIDFGTDARTYMSSGVSRDVHFWNERVSEYQTWVIPKIRAIISDFEGSRGIFSEGNVRANGEAGVSLDDQKKVLLRERLRTLLGAPLMGALASLNGEKSQDGMARANELIDYISELEGKVMDSSERDKRITWWTAQQTEMLKITPSKIQGWKKELSDKAKVFYGETLQLSENITDSQKKAFFAKIFDRIKNRERIIQEGPYDPEIVKARKEGKILEDGQRGVIIETEALGFKGKKSIAYKEAQWFREFLDDTAPVKSTDYTSLGKIPTFGDAFYEYLTQVVIFKRQDQFVKNLETNGTATKWRD